MIEATISVLITLVVLAICVYLILWVLEIVGISPPPKVIQLLWVVVVLFAILLIVKTVLPHSGLRLGGLNSPISTEKVGAVSYARLSR